MCSGDVGDGLCAEAGFTDIAYQGCPCAVNGGDVPNRDDHKVSPEDTGSDTQTCDNCLGDTLWNGIRDSSVDISGGLYCYCSCCSADSMACADRGSHARRRPPPRPSMATVKTAREQAPTIS